jgi:hypothetical protein
MHGPATAAPNDASVRLQVIASGCVPILRPRPHVRCAAGHDSGSTGSGSCRFRSGTRYRVAARNSQKHPEWVSHLGLFSRTKGLHFRDITGRMWEGVVPTYAKVRGVRRPGMLEYPIAQIVFFGLVLGVVGMVLVVLNRMLNA